MISARLARAGVVAAVVTLLACGASTSATHPRSILAAPEDCGDMVDPADVCPIHDGCPRVNDGHSSETDNDGCPGEGGIPFATTCDGDAQRFAHIAVEILLRPKLTTLRIRSSAEGCSEVLRLGLERAGVAHERIETRQSQEHSSQCQRWGYFSVAAWDGGRCKDDSAH
jgi:hypothetical protein